MATLTTPRTILTSVDFDFSGGEDRCRVCSNCGSIFFKENSRLEIEEHLKGCEEIKAPFVWALTKLSKAEQGGDSPEEDNMHKLTCNGRTIFVAPRSFFTDVDKLNLWQVSPFERVSQEYIYKYSFNDTFAESLTFLSREFDELSEQVGDNREIVERGAKYLPKAVSSAYMDALAKVETAVMDARQALERLKSLPDSAA
jgi:hypothetical protein